MTTETQARAVPRQRGLDEAWEQLTDGLFTYCLSVLCDQDAAVAAVREVRRLAARHRRRLRQPDLLRAWLYALARHSCLVRLDGAVPGPSRSGCGRPGGPARLRRLAWPETAGTTPAQREALELTGRHGLRTEELAAVLGLRPEQAGALLAQAVCEVERTAAALSVLAADDCPELRRLGRERGPVLGPALRGELVRHLDSCPTCRGTAEREAALGPWPGTPRASGTLSLVPAPAELAPAQAGAERLLTQLGRRDDPAVEPRFDRRGFPVQRSAPSQRAAVLRQRAVAGSVIAAVVAAPVVALFLTSQQRHTVEAAPVSSVSVSTPEPLSPGDQPPTTPTGGGSSPGRHGADVGPAAPGAPGSAAPGADQTVASVLASPVDSAGPGVQLSVTATEVSAVTVITLTNTGATAVNWQIDDSAAWLRLSRGSGTLAAGARFTVLVSVDQAATPVGPWTAQLLVRPSGAVVTLQGPGTGGRRTLPPPVSPPPASPPASPPPVTTPPASPPPAGSPPASPPPSATPSGPSSGPSGSPTPSPTASGGGAPTGAPSGSPGAGSPAPGASTTPPAAVADGRGRHRRT